MGVDDRDGPGQAPGTQTRLGFSMESDAGGRHPRRRTRLIKPTSIPRAIPIPDHVIQQDLSFASVSPHVYVHEGVRQQLQSRLQEKLGTPVILQMTDNRHSMFTTRKGDRSLRVRLHHMFLDADDAVVDALVGFIRKGDRRSSGVIDRFIEASSHKIRRAPARKKPIAIEWQGKVHNLKEIFDDVNRTYFGGRVECSITWGKASRGARRTSIKLGSYNLTYRLIRMHPALDQEWVPRYFVASVVHHEMSHASLHATDGAVAGASHGKDFKRTERRFHLHEKAAGWQRDNLGRLLRY